MFVLLYTAFVKIKLKCIYFKIENKPKLLNFT